MSALSQLCSGTRFRFLLVGWPTKDTCSFLYRGGLLWQATGYLVTGQQSSLSSASRRAFPRHPHREVSSLWTGFHAPKKICSDHVPFVGMEAMMYGDLMRYAQGLLPKLTSCQTVPSSLRLNLSFAAGSAQKSCVGQAACREI